MHSFKHYGFTLAEVLITLVIIGIIAAITIPAVINTYVETSTVSKLKKAISVLGQAKMLAETQNGPITDWEYTTGANATSSTQFWNYLRPHIQVAKDCGTATDCYQIDAMYYLNGTVHSNYNTMTSHYKFVLSDGSVMWLRTGGFNGTGKCDTADGGVENVCADFWIDVNGDKAPNTIGRDIFYIAMSVDGVFPFLNNDCVKTSTGLGCGAYIVKHNDMKYLH